MALVQERQDMSKLEKFHAINLDPYKSYGNIKIAELIKNKKIKSFNQYQIVCSLNGVIAAKEELFDNYAKSNLL